MGSDRTGGPAAAGVAETHSAVVFFLGELACKVKKPVDLGFLDFRTRAAREAVCHREVELNRRLAPDVYLGVSDVLDESGAVCEHLVVMRRMPDDRRLATLVRAGADVDVELGQLARLMARFHAEAERGAAPDRAAGVDALTGRWATNTAELLPFTPEIVPAEQVHAVDALAHRYLGGRRALLDRRIADGRACDGHGDLLADDVFCLADGPRVLDCIEFDDALRLGDGLADVAFLAMDLERLGRPDLADRSPDGPLRAGVLRRGPLHPERRRGHLRGAAGPSRRRPAPRRDRGRRCVVDRPHPSKRRAGLRRAGPRRRDRAALRGPGRGGRTAAALEG